MRLLLCPVAMYHPGFQSIGLCAPGCWLNIAVTRCGLPWSCPSAYRSWHASLDECRAFLVLLLLLYQPPAAAAVTAATAATAATATANSAVRGWAPNPRRIDEAAVQVRVIMLTASQPLSRASSATVRRPRQRTPPASLRRWPNCRAHAGQKSGIAALSLAGPRGQAWNKWAGLPGRLVLCVSSCPSPASREEWPKGRKIKIKTETWGLLFLSKPDRPCRSIQPLPIDTHPQPLLLFLSIHLQSFQSKKKKHRSHPKTDHNAACINIR